MLKGYRTYILAAVAIISAAAAYLVGDITLAEAGQLVITGALGASIRAGVKNDVAEK